MKQPIKCGWPHCLHENQTVKSGSQNGLGRKGKRYHLDCWEYQKLTLSQVLNLAVKMIDVWNQQDKELAKEIWMLKKEKS